jgi:hypothetical protein
MPVVIEVDGVRKPEAVSLVSRTTFELEIRALGLEPLSGCESAQSSGLKSCSFLVLLLLEAYTRGAPIGQYMALQCHVKLHSWGHMLAGNEVAVFEQLRL